MTIREHLEAIRERHGQGLGDQCYRCEALWPCPEHEHAVAALAILDTAAPALGASHIEIVDWQQWRVVLDPEPDDPGITR